MATSIIASTAASTMASASNEMVYDNSLPACAAEYSTQLLHDLAKESLIKVRRNYGTDPLRRAIGTRAKTIIDATAGWATDAAHLARVGYHVIAIEKNPMLCAVLQCAHADCDDATLKARLTILHGNSIEYLQHLTTRPDVIYLDPMYPPKSKSAAAKKQIAVLRKLVGATDDSKELFVHAMACARQRVVIKRARRAKPLYAGVVGETNGKLVRFDIYQPYTK